MRRQPAYAGHESQIRVLHGQGKNLVAIARITGVKISAIRSLLSKDRWQKKRADELAAQIAADGGIPKSVDALDISVRSANCLENFYIETIDQLLAWSGHDLVAMCKNFGMKSFLDIQLALAKHGIDWRYMQCEVCGVNMKTCVTSRDQLGAQVRVPRVGGDLVPKVYFCSMAHLGVWEVMTS
jgi:hypothetical protein